MEKSYSESYAAAGVDITAGYRSVELMKQYVARTMNEHCIGGLGGFGGLFAPDLTGMSEPVLVSGTDGVWQRCFALAETRIYYVVAWNKLYRRSLFQHLRYAPGRRYEDQFLLPHLLAQCKTIACLAAPGYRYVQRSGSIMAQGSSRTYLDRPEYLLDWCAYFTQKGDALRAEGLLNDAIQNLAEKQCFDLSTPAQQARYRAACRACADSYTALAAATAQRSMRLRAALLRIGLPAYQAFLKHKT